MSKTDEDLDYHMHTGELSDYFDDKPRKTSGSKGGRNNFPPMDVDGCFFVFAFFVIFALIIYACVHSCTSNNDKKEIPSQNYYTPSQITPAPAYQTPYVPQEYQAPTPQPSTIKTEKTNKEEPTKVVPKHFQPTSQTIISRYYEEGYDKGYDDGEDDAVSGNGWGGQFDDSCPYKGWKRKEFQLGYEEGYEAGYEDVREDD